MNYSVYEISTGKIIKAVQCHENDIGMQYDATTHAHLIGIFADDLHYVVNGVAVAMPAKPSATHIFNYTTKQWVDQYTPEQHTAIQWEEIRGARDALLAGSDWTQVPDAPTDKAAWATYRQALRDLTKQPDPFNLNWPVKP